MFRYISKYEYAYFHTYFFMYLFNDFYMCIKTSLSLHVRIKCMCIHVCMQKHHCNETRHPVGLCPCRDYFAGSDLQVTAFRKKVTTYSALSRKMTYKLMNPTRLRHPVLMYYCISKYV